MDGVHRSDFQTSPCFWHKAAFNLHRWLKNWKSRSRVRKGHWTWFWRFFIAFTFTTMVFLLTGESAFYGGSVAANSDFSLLAALCLQSGTVALLGCFSWFLWNKAFPRNPLLPLWVGMESLRNSKALMLTPGYHLFPRLGIRAVANRALGSFPAPRKRCSRGNWNSVAKKKRHFTVNL